MKITRLKLIGYKRLLLRNIKEFEIRPQSVYQLLIGTNGSGKSSVMQELSPLPAFSGDYIKGGSKTIELEHRGKNYILTSDFSHGNKHSFVVNGAEENPGGTMTVQKDLVQSHFGFNDDLHDLLIDVTRFTNMTPQKRREWIILLSGGDLSFAMGVFNKLKSKARDMVGVVKHLNTRLMNETSKLPTAEKINEQIELTEKLKQELTMMMEEKDPSVVQDEKTIADRMFSKIQMIEEESIAILEADIRRPAFIGQTVMSSVDEITSIINETVADQRTNEQLLEHYVKEHTKVAEIIEALEKSNAQGMDDLKNRLETLYKQRSEAESNLRTFERVNGARSVLTAFEAILPELNELFSQIRPNDDNYFNMEERDKQRNNQVAANNALEAISIDVARIRERLDHIENAKSENCPKCGYIFTPGGNVNEKAKLQNLLERIAEKQTQYKKQLEESNSYLEQYMQYAEQRRRIARVLESVESCKPLWSHMVENDFIASHPRKAIGLFSAWQHHLNECIKIDEIEDNIALYKDAVDKASQLGENTQYTSSIEELNNNIENATEKKQTFNKTIQALTRYKNTVSEVIDRQQRINHLWSDVGSDFNKLTSSIKNALLQKCISEHLSMLSHSEQQLISARSIQGIVDDLNASLEQAQQDAKIYKILTDELSPTDGLIAEQLKGSIECIVEQMNNVISSIWTYDLQILPCGLEEEELDYKFPMTVNHSELYVPDVGRASSSQVDVVDFAFKLVAMLYLELDDFPLYLDELAPSLDEQHRINIMNFVRQLVETKKCSQMFMISHYNTAHGSFLNADVCVMDDRNIINKPQDYNQHVKML